MDRLQQLYIEHQQKLFTYFYIRTQNRSVAEDLTQDVFYEASKTIHHYRAEASLTSWMYAIANNLLKKYYRSKKYEKALLEKLEQPEPLAVATDVYVEQKDQLQKLAENIRQLDDQSQQIVLLRLYGELSFKEIGQLIGQSENYARVQFHRLKVKLQRGEHNE